MLNKYKLIFAEILNLPQDSDKSLCCFVGTTMYEKFEFLIDYFLTYIWLNHFISLKVSGFLMTKVITLCAEYKKNLKTTEGQYFFYKTI